MGATVTVDKKVAALVTPSGKIGYVLFEQTYEKNCYPHHPHWSCVALGYLEEVMKRIFSSAASCEGGSLQGRGGYIRPEGYIEGWMKEMAMPSLMPDIRKTMVFGNSLSSQIPLLDFYDKKEIKPIVLGDLRNDGFGHVADQLENGEFEASLVEHFDILRSIYTIHPRDFGAWRFVTPPSSVVYSSTPADHLGYARAAAKGANLTIPDMKVLPYGERLLVQQPDGTYRCTGGAWCVVQDFIRDYARCEIMQPGSFKKAIRSIREAAKAAAPVDGTVTVELSTRSIPPDRKYYIEQIQDLGQAMGARTPTDFTTTFDAVQAKGQELGVDLLYKLCYCEQLIWRVQGQKPSQSALFEEDELMAEA